MYRLEEIGLIGKILDIIKSIYKSPKVSLIHRDKTSQTFLRTIDLSFLGFCSNEWGLELDLSKTKIMIFNKQGATTKKLKFYFQGQEREIVKQYTHIGFTFIPSGRKHKEIENLITKAKSRGLYISDFYISLKEKLSTRT